MVSLSRILTVISGVVIITMMPCTYIHAANWDDPNVHLAQSIKDRAFVDGRNMQVVSTKGMPESMRSPMTAGAGGTAAAASGSVAPSGTVATSMAKWNDSNVDLAQSIENRGFVNGKNGQPVNVEGMPESMLAPGKTNSKTPTSLTKKASNTAKNVKANWGKLSRKGKLLRGVAVLGGAFMVYEGTTGNGPHSWGNVVSGALGGLSAGASIGTLFGPGLGNIIGGAVGAVGGAAVSGAKFFSESGGDCVYDEVLPNVYTCCATVFNKGSRYVDIGGTMLCELPDGNPGVRTCLNGHSTTTHSIFKNDRWSDCQAPDTMWCPGVQKPANDEGVLYMPTLDGLPSTATKQSKIVKESNEGQIKEEDLKHVKVCWNWVCDDTAGYTKQDNKCTKTMEPAPSTDTTTIDGMINYLEKLRADIIKDCGTLEQ